MPIEPQVKRVIAFIDGQNLFHAAKRAFGCAYPNFDPRLLVERVLCTRPGWNLVETRFYTGIPDAKDNPLWNHFWNAKLATLGTRGIQTFSRPLRYRYKTVRLPNGGVIAARVGQEKGIDVRMALDIVRLAREGRYDVALIFSQDQDLSEAVEEVRSISRQHYRWIRSICVFPVSPTYSNRRGINGTEWFVINQQMYNACIDLNDYRPKRRAGW